MKEIIKTFNAWKTEIFAVPGLALFLIASVFLVEWIDPTIGSYNPYMIQKAFFAWWFLLFGNFIVWLGQKFTWHPMYQWWKQLKTKFELLDPITKSWFVLSLHLSQVFFYILLLAIL